MLPPGKFPLPTGKIEPAAGMGEGQHVLCIEITAFDIQDIQYTSVYQKIKGAMGVLQVREVVHHEFCLQSGSLGFLSGFGNR